MNDDRDISDPALDAMLRAHSAETPPAHVDAAVLAAAHRAVANASHGARATHAWRWWMPLAAAAAIGVIVVGILPLSPAIVDQSSPVATDAPSSIVSAPSPPPSAPAARADASASTSASPADQRGARAPSPVPRAKTEAQAQNAERATASAEQLRESPAAATPLRANPAPAPPSADRGASPAPAFARPPEAAGALRQNAATADSRDDVLVQPHTADEWIARIRALRRAGNEPDAVRTLAGFRQAFTDADARLPTDLRDWATALPSAPK